MYYIVAADNGQIIERWDYFEMADLKKLAEECECDVWVIEGEHSGITYERPKDPILTRPVFQWNNEPDYRGG